MSQVKEGATGQKKYGEGDEERSNDTNVFQADDEIHVISDTAGTVVGQWQQLVNARQRMRDSISYYIVFQGRSRVTKATGGTERRCKNQAIFGLDELEWVCVSTTKDESRLLEQ